MIIPNQPSPPVQFDDPLPKGVDAVVIGGGIIGILSALYLARSGLSTAVLEKGIVGGEQSSRNWGWIRQQGRDEAELPIMMEACRLWQEIDAEVDGRTGFKKTGIMYLASTQKKLDRRLAWLEMAQKYGLDSRHLRPEDLSKFFKTKHHPWKGAVQTPSDARAEPWQAVTQMAHLCHSENVCIKEHCAVRALDIQAQIIKGVHTEAGYVACENVLLAGGAWSSLFLQNHDIRIPQLSVRAIVAQTAPLPEFYAGNAADETLAFRRRNDGGYTLAPTDFLELMIGWDGLRHATKWLPAASQSWHESHFKLAAPKHYPDAWQQKRRWSADEKSPFEHMRILNPPISEDRINQLQQRLQQKFPALENVEIKHSWAGMIDAMPDLVPIVDSVTGIEGLTLATGMSGHGFGIAPGFAKIISQIINKQPPSYDISRFRFNRFSDGSKLKVGPSI